MNQVQRLLISSIQDSAQIRGELLGIDLCVDQLVFFFSTHVSAQRRVLAKIEAYGGRKEMGGRGGRFNQGRPSARSLVTSKVLFSCELREGGTRGRSQILLYPDMLGCYI